MSPSGLQQTRDALIFAHSTSFQMSSTTDYDNNGSIRKSPPRFLGKRNRNTSFDQQQQQGSIKKTLSWGPLPTDDLYNQDDPSNHHHQDGKASSSSAAPINPSRSPIIEDDDDDTDTTTHPTKYEDVTFPIKFSLSHDFNNKEDEDASLSEYLTEANFTMGPSPRGSPTMTFLPDDTANMMMFPGSPLNVHGSDTFDFCDVSGDDDHNNATKLLSSPPTIKNSSSSLCDQVAAIAANDTTDLHHHHHELPPPRLPVGDSLISRSHSSDHTTATTTQYNLAPRKSSNSSYRPGHQVHPSQVHHTTQGPTQHLSPGQTIYNVASKSVGSPSSPYYNQHNWHVANNHHHSSSHSHHSHSTPLTTTADRREDALQSVSETSPEFNPPRSNLRESKYQATITVSTSHDDTNKNDNASLKKPAASSSSSSSSNKIVDPITPSPVSTGTHNNIRQAVSDESSSPTIAPTVHHPPPHRPYHPPPHHHPPSSSGSGGGGSGPYGGSYNMDHSSGSHHHQRWSDSLHMAPLPPYVQPQHHHHQSHHPTHPWQQQAGGQRQNLPPALPSSGRGGGSQGYHNHNHHPHPPSCYSPYYHQATPDRATSTAAAASTTTTSVPPSSLSNNNSNTQEEEDSAAERAYWNKHHHLLHQFLLQYGHCNIPPGYGIGTHYETLYQWCVDQRTEYQKMCRGNNGMEETRSTMTPERVRILTSMGFVWGAPLPSGRGHHSTGGTSHGARPSSSNKSSSSSSYSSWDKWMEMLSSFKAKHGHVDVPLKYEPNPALGTFVNRQRSEYRKYHSSKPTSMTPERISELNALGFTWAIRDTHTSWNERYHELKQFRNVNGHTNVPKIYNKNPSLGYWVNEQRFQYRRLMKQKSSSMSEEKIRLLNELDFKVCFFIYVCLLCLFFK